MSLKNKIVKSFYNWTFLVIAIVFVFLINIISSFVNKRWDMTEDERYSLSEGTINFLSNDSILTNKITLRIYLAGNLPSEIKVFKNALEDKLKEFRQFAGDKIQYQFINPLDGTEQEQQELFETIYNKGKGIIPMDVVYMKDGTQNQLLIWPGAEIDYNGATVNSIQLLPGTPPGKPYQLKDLSDLIQNSVNNLEYMLVSTIKRSINDQRKRVAFLQGHGELNFAETQRARALISPNYAITDVILNDSLEALNNVDGLIIARPTKPFSEKDLYIIDQFVMKGGRLMCFLDGLRVNEDSLMRMGTTHSIRNTTGIERMLFDYGLKLNDNYVIDVNCAPKPVPMAKVSLIPWFYHILATPTGHPIARNLEPVSLKYSSEVQFVGTKNNHLTPVLTSSTNSMRTGMAPLVSLGMAMNYGQNPELVPNPKDENNKVCLAGLSEGTYVSFYRNRIVDEFAKNPSVHYLERSDKESKILLIGNGRFLANLYDSMPNPKTQQMMYRPAKINDLRFDPQLAELGVPHSFGNQEFIQNMVEYMLGDNTVIDLRSRQIDIHEIDSEKVKKDATFYKIINMILPCAIIILLGFGINYLRKRKYSK